METITPGSRIFYEFNLEHGLVIKKVFNHSVWWYLVKWDTGRQSLVNPSCVSSAGENEKLIWDLWGAI